VSGPERPEASDDELILAAVRGEVRAFETLLGRHESKVLRVLRLLGVPAQDREDIAQEVFLRVFRHLNGFRTGQSFGAWIYRVSVNAVRDYRDRAGRLRREEAPWTAALEDSPGPEALPDEELDRRRVLGRLEAALHELSERERAVFVLRELEGLDTKDVAAALGITRITVRRHLALARGRLRRALEMQTEEKNRQDR
jgi:RNA polymerase sigma-70 factor (ECF subfamily)